MTPENEASIEKFGPFMRFWAKLSFYAWAWENPRTAIIVGAAVNILGWCLKESYPGAHLVPILLGSGWFGAGFSTLIFERIFKRD